MSAFAENIEPLLKETKPDFHEACERWNHYWAGEVWKRPPVVGAVPKPGYKPGGVSHRYYKAIHGLWDEALTEFDAYLDSMEFPAETIPRFDPDLGPDQFAAFFGGDLKTVEDSKETSWIDPIVDDWSKTLPFTFDQYNPWWQKLLSYSRKAADHSCGRYLIGVCDLHSNADILRALRGTERLCTDFYDVPI